MRVLVLERDDIAGAASGRNSGILQHPMDHALAPLFAPSLEHYREVAEHGLELPEEPSGILLLSPAGRWMDEELAALSAFPELAAEALGPGAPAALEPALAPDLAGVLMHTGFPVGPATATRAFAARARAAGATFRTGAAAQLVDGGVIAGGE